MNNYLIAIAVLLLGASAGFLFQQDRHRKAIESEHSAILDLQMQVEQIAGDNIELRDKISTTQRDTEATIQAQESARMAVRKAREEEQEQQRKVAELIERLTIEAENRKKAETALTELNDKIAALAGAQAEAEEKLASLEEARVRQEMPVSSEGELDDVFTTLEQKRAELARLETQKQELNEEYQVTLRRQTELKEDLMRDNTFTDDLRELLEAILKVLGF